MKEFRIFNLESRNIQNKILNPKLEIRNLHSPTNMFSISVLISGGGTTLKNLIAVQNSGTANWKISSVISNNPGVKGLAFAEAEGIPHCVVNHRDYSGEEEFSAAVYAAIENFGAAPDLIVMGGFLRKLNIPAPYTNKIINIHPSLIPSFCGKGNYGSRVHQSVIEYGCKLTGCTVHFVDNQYDHGPIIAQRGVPVANDDTPQSLAARVFVAECELLPEVISMISAGCVSLSGRTVQIKSEIQ